MSLGISISLSPLPPTFLSFIGQTQLEDKVTYITISKDQLSGAQVRADKGESWFWRRQESDQHRRLNLSDG